MYIKIGQEMCIRDRNKRIRLREDNVRKVFKKHVAMRESIIKRSTK